MLSSISWITVFEELDCPVGVELRVCLLHGVQYQKLYGIDSSTTPNFSLNMVWFCCCVNLCEHSRAAHSPLERRHKRCANVLVP